MVEGEDSALESDARAALNSALAKLPAEQREAIELSVGARMNYLQIAERTGVSGKTVQRRLNRGLLALRYAMRDNSYFAQNLNQESTRT